MTPLVKAPANIIRNEIVGEAQGMSMGVARIRAISMSKIINKIISRKNRREKGFRGIEFKFIPHSKDEFLLDHFFIVEAIIVGSRIIVALIALIISQ